MADEPDLLGFIQSYWTSRPSAKGLGPFPNQRLVCDGTSLKLAIASCTWMISAVWFCCFPRRSIFPKMPSQSGR